MVIVPIPPTAHIGHAKKQSRFQFALTHICEQNPQYAAEYANIGNDPGYHLIMDNGAFENGSSDALRLVNKWIIELAPDEVVLPDRMFMADETLRLTKQALGNLEFNASIESLRKPVLKQGVVHGRNHKEWLHCAYSLFDLGVDILAIPKDYEAWSGGREVLLAMVEKIGLPVHLLGMEKNPWTYTRWRNKELVRSMDTAKPYILGIGKMQLFLAAGRHNKVPRQGDFFDTVLDLDQLTYATRNHNDWKKCYN